MSEEKKEVESEVVPSLPDTFVSTLYNIGLGVGAKTISSQAFKSYNEEVADNFSTVIGSKIIATNTSIASAAKAQESIITELSKAFKGTDKIKLSADVVEKAKEYQKEVSKDIEHKQGAFWVTLFVGYIVGGFGRAGVALLMESEKISWNFFRKNEQEKSKRSDIKKTKFIVRNVSGVLLGGLAGALAAMVQSASQGAGESPKATGFFLGCAAGFAACIVAEIRDLSIKAKPIEEPPSNPTEAIPTSVAPKGPGKK